MKRPETTGSGHAVPMKFSDASFKSDYPDLYEWMTCDRWDDGKKRETTTLLLFLEDGCLKANVRDRAFDRQAFISARSLIEALQMADSGIRDETLLWRPMKQFGKK